jgi:hypothetical protein
MFKRYEGWFHSGDLREENPMRKSIVFIVALVTVAFVTNGAWAKSIIVTESYVKSKCGKAAIKPEGGACRKDCGTSQCEYSCVLYKGVKTCQVIIYRTTQPGDPKTGGIAPTGGLLEASPGLPTQGPARTGTPSSR